MNEVAEPSISFLYPLRPVTESNIYLVCVGLRQSFPDYVLCPRTSKESSPTSHCVLTYDLCENQGMTDAAKDSRKLFWGALNQCNPSFSLFENKCRVMLRNKGLSHNV